MAEEWQLVSRRRRGNPRSRASQSQSSSSKLHEEPIGGARSSSTLKHSNTVHEEAVEPVHEVSEAKQQLIARRVRAIADVLRTSLLITEALRVITKHFGSEEEKVQAVDGSSVDAEDKAGELPTLVGYGLGSFCASSNAVHQLGFLVALKGILEGRKGCTESEDVDAAVLRQLRVEIFDPAMNKSDAAIAKHFQLNVIQENEHCRRRVVGNTVFFMPHCGKALYQNVLASNWGLTMPKLIIIGNSFSAYGDRVLAAKERQELVLVDVLPYLKEVPLSCGVSKTHEDFTRYEAAFNDISVHTFPPLLLERVIGDDTKLAERMAALVSATQTEED